METKRPKGRPRLRENQSSQRITLTFPEDMVTTLRQEAKERKISLAALIREKINV